MEQYLLKLRIMEGRNNIIYLTILLLIIIAFPSLPFIRTTISTKATGITRPQTERTEIKPMAAGIVENITAKEGDTVLAQ
jgi:membrane fusion protein, peptide pheromone/bacteriocin exporter